LAKSKSSLLKDLLSVPDVQKKSMQIPFMDRLMMGGLPAGTVTLIAGEPGIGKSTLLFQMLASHHEKALYVSTEEALSQIGQRFKKLVHHDAEQMHILAEQKIEEILAQMSVLRPDLMVLDSLQMLHSESDFGKTGIKDMMDTLVSEAKRLQITLFVVGHVTKDGEIAGPKTLEHLVDTVLTFTLAEDSRTRILQIQKNRYGPSGEVVLLEMTERGLEESKEGDDFWIQAHQEAVYGCAVAPVVVGTRIVPVEIQALVVNSYFPSPRRSTSGFELNRLLLILAVLEKRLKLPFSRMDVYLNVVGGLRLSDPGADLAVAAALVSAYSEKPIDLNLSFLGEIGLTGELRPVSRQSERLTVMTKQHQKMVVAPMSSDSKSRQNVIARPALESALNSLI
jgi:DNA repair protein RadA/Sms